MKKLRVLFSLLLISGWFRLEAQYTTQIEKQAGESGKTDRPDARSGKLGSSHDPRTALRLRPFPIGRYFPGPSKKSKGPARPDVGTFREVAAYIRERDALNLQIDQKGEDRYTVTPALDLDPELFTDPLNAVIERPGISRIRINQSGTALNFRIYPEKTIFDFDPFGDAIQIEIIKTDN